MEENALVAATRYLFSSTWFIVLVGILITIYLGACLWKILSSEEGFLFGYGNWVVGKWQDVKEAVRPASVKPDPSPESGASRFTFEPQRKRELVALAEELQVQANVLKLSRLLDGDLALLMTDDGIDWENRVLRALQTTVSGLIRVVRPAASCRCGFFILGDDEEHLVLVVGEGYTGHKAPSLALEQSCAGRAFVTGDKYYCRDIATDPVYFPSTSGNRSFRSIACVPVRAGKMVFGVICLDAPESGAFSTEDFSYLELFATKLAVFCAYHTRQTTAEHSVRPMADA
jgi:putative methionine-R-sulfoxide reductase with GAF domain